MRPSAVRLCFCVVYFVSSLSAMLSRCVVVWIAVAKLNASVRYSTNWSGSSTHQQHKMVVFAPLVAPALVTFTIPLTPFSLSLPLPSPTIFSVGSLNKDEIEQVLAHLITTDHGEWLDAQHSQFLVLWDTAQETANAIYSWAQKTGKIGDIYTVYDIYAEDDSTTENFHGLHPRCIVKALTRLQEGGRAKVSRAEGKPLDEWGVKFLDEQ